MNCFRSLVLTLAAVLGMSDVAVAQLLVGAANGGGVQEYNATTGASMGNFTSGGPGMSGYASLAFSLNGNLYVKGWSTSQIQQFNGTTGAYVSTFASNSSFGVASAVLFGPNGNLFVGAGSSILQYNGSTGALVGSFVSSGSGGLVAVNGMRFGLDGNLYVSNTNFGNSTYDVLRYNGTTGAFIDTFVASGSGGLSGNRDLVFGPDGNLYVASSNNGVVERYNGTTGAFLGTFTSARAGAFPWGLAFGPDGNLYVSEDGPSDVARFNGTTGAFMDVFATGTNANPTYLAFFSVPEPNSLVLLSLAGAAAIAWRRRPRRVG